MGLVYNPFALCQTISEYDDDIYKHLSVLVCGCGCVKRMQSEAPEH